MTTHEAAQRLGLSLVELYELLSRGKLSAWLCPSPRPGREERTAVRLERKEVEALATRG